MLSNIITSKKVNRVICSELNDIFSSRHTIVRLYKLHTEQECCKMITPYTLMLQQYNHYKHGKSLRKNAKSFLKNHDLFLSIFKRVIKSRLSDMYNCLFITYIWMAVLIRLEKEAKKNNDMFICILSVQLQSDLIKTIETYFGKQYDGFKSFIERPIHKRRRSIRFKKVKNFELHVQQKNQMFVDSLKLRIGIS